MIGLIVAAVGYLAAVVGVVAQCGTWTLIPAGVVLVAVGLFVDWEAATNGKRR